jgi:hypothetical protein
MELSIKSWRTIGAGGHMALMDMRPRNNQLCQDYSVRVVANIFRVPTFSMFLAICYLHLYRC